MTNFERVREFNLAFGHPAPEQLQMLIPLEQLELTKKLIHEEGSEALEAIAEGDINHIAKELCDLLVVAYRAGAVLGIPMDACFAEVHRSNMSKLGADGKPIYREDGKILKGPNYSEADMRRVLNATS